MGPRRDPRLPHRRRGLGGPGVLPDRGEGGLRWPHRRTGLGGTGQSFNYWDAARKVWQQDWVASGGTNLHLTGGMQEGAMVLEADTPAPNGGMAHHKAMWIPQADGRVRQYWRQSTDGGKSWTVVFDGYYRKK